jgi:hypothetical protein
LNRSGPAGNVDGPGLVPVSIIALLLIVIGVLIEFTAGTYGETKR